MHYNDFVEKFAGYRSENNFIKKSK